jgi:hypothetical protein
MARIHGLQHIESFLPAYFSHDDSVRTHPQTVDNQLSCLNSAPSTCGCKMAILRSAFEKAREEDLGLLLCDPQEEMFVFSLRQFGLAVCNGFVDLGGDHRFKKCPALLEENVRVGVGFDKQLVGRLVVGVRNVVVEAERPEVLTVSNAARRGFDVVGFRLFLADRAASRQDDEKPDEA